MALIKSYKEFSPKISKDTFVAENASIIGNVEIASNCSIWYGAVIRSEGSLVKIGEGSNLQDNAVIHVTPVLPTIIGKNVSIGHGAIVHAAKIGDGCLIGMGAILLNGCNIGAGSFIGAGCVVGEGMLVPEGSLVVGSPAKILGPLPEKLDKVRVGAYNNYQNYTKELTK